MSIRRKTALRTSGVLVATLALVAGSVAATTQAASAVVTNPTTVSLTFDDSNSDQVAAEQTLKASGLLGTFYTVSGWIGAPGYLTSGQLATIAADGNEIAGHTVTHPDLIQIDPAEAQRQICNGRATLQSWGYKPVDFAYPFSDANAAVEKLAQGCGYNTSRGLGDVRSPESCQTCVYAEKTPPQDANYLKAPDEVDSTWTLAQLEAEVTNAANNGGGWVILTFHHICSDIGAADCPTDVSTTPAIYNAFITWLKGYAANAANKTSVKTVDQTVRGYLGAKYPAYVNATAVPNRAPAAPGVNALSNTSLETPDTFTGFPSCFQPGGWGANTATWGTTTAAHTGTTAEQLTVTNYSSGDAKLLPTLDLGTCSPTVVPGKTYNLSVWYQSTGITQFALYYRDATGAWYYWTSGPWLAPASTWTQASFTTPAVPANAVGMSFGLALIANGSLITDDYSLVDPGTAPAAATPVKAATPKTSAVTALVADLQLVVTVLTHRVTHVSHLRPLLLGGQSLRPGARIAVPELAGGATRD